MALALQVAQQLLDRQEMAAQVCQVQLLGLHSFTQVEELGLEARQALATQERLAAAVVVLAPRALIAVAMDHFRVL